MLLILCLLRSLFNYLIIYFLNFYSFFLITLFYFILFFIPLLYSLSFIPQQLFLLFTLPSPSRTSKSPPSFLTPSPPSPPPPPPPLLLLPPLPPLMTSFPQKYGKLLPQRNYMQVFSSFPPPLFPSSSLLPLTLFLLLSSLSPLLPLPPFFLFFFFFFFFFFFLFSFSFFFLSPPRPLSEPWLFCS